MSTVNRLSDGELLERYTDQPARLPVEIRRRIGTALGILPEDVPIVAYALADLDAELHLTHTWVVITGDTLVICPTTGPPMVAARAAISSTDLQRSLSCNTLRIEVSIEVRGEAHGEMNTGAALPERTLILRFTQRQRFAMESLSRLLEADAKAAGYDADLHYAEQVARPIRDAQALVAKSGAAVLWRLLGYMLPYRKQLVRGGAAALLITGLSLVPPMVTGYLIDEVVGPVQRGEISAQGLQQVAWLALGVLALTYAVRRLAAWVRLRNMAIIGEWVARDLRTAIYQHLQKLSVSYYSKKKTGSLITRVTSDTDRLWEFLALGVVDVSLSLVMLVGLGAVLISLDWRLGLVITVPIPLFCLLIHLNGARMRHLFVRAFRKWSRVTDVVSDTIPGFAVVKAFDQHQREQERFTQRNFDVVDEFNAIHRVWTSFWPALMLAVDTTIVLVWALALPRLLGYDNWAGPPLSLGTFVSFLLYTTMLVAPIEVIGQIARVMNRATTSAHRVFEVLDTEPEVVEPAQPRRIEIEGAVRFEDVSFAYDGIRQALSGVSFDVRPGEMIGLVGPSGGGKTTITNLVARFYDTTAGRVLIDGVDVRALDGGALRRQVGMVLQDPYLFHGSVLDNIRYGVPEATAADVIEAARAANAHDFVCKLPHGYETLVGERGHSLSGGERQRISIARAILANPRILILDEATSAVDTETERKIQDAMDRLAAGRTVFAIAHRLSTLRRASRIFTIKDGKLVEQGRHADLLAKPEGIYRRLYEHQRQMQELN